MYTSTFNHPHIVGAISNGQSDSLLLFLDQVHHLLLLKRSDTATDNSLALASCVQKKKLHILLESISLQEHSMYHV